MGRRVQNSGGQYDGRMCGRLYEKLHANKRAFTDRPQVGGHGIHTKPKIEEIVANRRSSNLFIGKQYGGCWHSGMHWDGCVTR